MSRNYPEWSTQRTQEKMNVHLQNICRCISKQPIGHKRGFCSFVNCWRCGRQAKSSRESRWHYVRILTKKKNPKLAVTNSTIVSIKQEQVKHSRGTRKRKPRRGCTKTQSKPISKSRFLEAMNKSINLSLTWLGKKIINLPTSEWTGIATQL